MRISNTTSTSSTKRAPRPGGRFPRSRRKVPEFDDENTRELIADSYRIIYTVEPDQVIIAAVIPGKRML
ncbi:MAG TPA: type II toxin-antitoxin system RelE/ParE family toxin [Candidatus Polarisedimenticolia bacterium]|nr:type II toxin-antitoxin system RelE/ParE family toxin [Candidatus Polarisedimenticolia bacterium]